MIGYNPWTASDSPDGRAAGYIECMSDTVNQVDPTAQKKPGRLADMVRVQTGPSFSQAFGAATLIKIAVLAALFVLMNSWQFSRLISVWKHDPNWSHGFIIPLFSLYLLYVRRDELFAAKRRVNLWGLGIMLVSVFIMVVGFYPIRTHWFCHLAMVLLLLGLVLYLGGPQIIGVTWLPILYLVFAIPIPEILYARIAVPLQELAAKGATVVLQLAGVQIESTASSLQVTSMSGQIHPLTVAEACSGMRSLMAFLALGVALAYLAERAVWQRIILVVAAVPVAILCNVIRVTITCSMFALDKPELGQDFMHEFMGMVMLIPAALLLWLLSWLLQSLFIEVEDDADGGDESSSREGATA